MRSSVGGKLPNTDCSPASAIHALSNTCVSGYASSFIATGTVIIMIEMWIYSYDLHKPFRTLLQTYIE